MNRQRTVGAGILFGVVLLLSLFAAGVTLHGASLEGPGAALLRTDIALLLLYGAAGICILRLRSANAIAAATIGAQIGLVLGAVGIANHLVEAFVPVRLFVFVIVPVFLGLALPGIAGAAAWERTASFPLALMSGVSTAIVGTLITLGFATSFNLLFAAHTDRHLHEAFTASGMSDPGAFRVRKILEASSEILVRMPVVAACLASPGAVAQAWISRESSRTLARAVSLLTPLLFAAGAAALWYANTLEREARPPFVLSGVLLSSIAVCAIYPAWSAWHTTRGS